MQDNRIQDIMILMYAVLVFQTTYSNITFNLAFFSTCVFIVNVLQIYFEFEGAKQTYKNTCIVLLGNAMLTCCMHIFYMRIGCYMLNIKQELQQSRALLNNLDTGVVVID